MTRLFSSLLLSAVCLSSCSSDYWSHRGRDAGDLLTCSVQQGIGAGVQASLFETTLGAQNDWCGWSRGEWQANKWNVLGHADDLKGDLRAGALFGSIHAWTGNSRKPEFMKVNILLIPVSFEGSKPHADCESPRDLIADVGRIDASLSLGVGLRLGVNFLEAIDLLLGFGTLDFMGDDLPPPDLEAKPTETAIEEPATSRGPHS